MTARSKEALVASVSFIFSPCWGAQHQQHQQQQKKEGCFGFVYTFLLQFAMHLRIGKVAILAGQLFMRATLLQKQTSVDGHYR